MNYSNIIGFPLFSLSIFQFISGILSVPHPNNIPIPCYEPILHIMIEVLFGFSARWFHRLFASSSTIHIFIHVSRGVWLRLLVIDSLPFVRFSGILLSFMSSIEGLLGYILNSGQTSYRGYMVLLGLSTITDTFEWLIIELSWCTRYVVVFRIFLLHSVIGWLLGIFILFHILVLHSFGPTNSIPYNMSSFLLTSYLVIFKDISIGLCFIFFYLFVFLFFHPDILGNADNSIVANPLSTPDHTIPELHFLVIFYLLRCIAYKFLGIICVAPPSFIILFHFY